MFSFITELGQSIAEFFTNIWSFLTWVWDQITQFFKILAPALSFFQSLLSSIPPLFLAFAVAILVVLIIYIILGRNAGGD